jgi:hypothetical protein
MNLLPIILLAVALVTSSGCHPKQRPVTPVTNDARAIAEAKSGFASVYSKTRYESFAPATVARFEPYTATLTNGEWYIRGTIPVGYRGIVPEAKVRASDGFTRVEGVEVGGRQ